MSIDDIRSMAARVGWLRLTLATLTVASDDGHDHATLKRYARVAKMHGARTGDIAQAARVTKAAARRWCVGIAGRYQRRNVATQ